MGSRNFPMGCCLVRPRAVPLGQTPRPVSYSYWKITYLFCPFAIAMLVNWGVTDILWITSGTRAKIDHSIFWERDINMNFTQISWKSSRYHILMVLQQIYHDLSQDLSPLRIIIDMFPNDPQKILGLVSR